MSNIGNSMMSILEKLFPRRKENSREEVKRRLKLIVAHDRAQLNPAMVERMRREILEVVSRYVELDLTGSEFSVESNQRDTALIASLPILRVKNLPISPLPTVALETEKETDLASVKIENTGEIESTGEKSILPQPEAAITGPADPVDATVTISLNNEDVKFNILSVQEGENEEIVAVMVGERSQTIEPVKEEDEQVKEEDKKPDAKDELDMELVSTPKENNMNQENVVKVVENISKEVKQEVKQ